MLTLDQKKAEIMVGDILCFHKKEKTISLLTRKGNRLYFSSKGYEDNKMFSSFINSKEDFINFSEFLGNLLCFRGKLLEENGSILAWQFTHTERGTEETCRNGTEITLNLELGLILFRNSKTKLQLMLSAKFLKNESDFYDMLAIITNIFDCSHEYMDPLCPGKILRRSFHC